MNVNIGADVKLAIVNCKLGRYEEFDKFTHDENRTINEAELSALSQLIAHENHRKNKYILVHCLTCIARLSNIAHVLPEMFGSILAKEFRSDCMKEIFNSRSTSNDFFMLPKEVRSLIRSFAIRINTGNPINDEHSNNLIISSVDRETFMQEKKYAFHIAAVLGFQNYRRKSGDFFSTSLKMQDAYNMIKDVLSEKCENFVFNANERKAFIDQMGRIKRKKLTEGNVSAILDDVLKSKMDVS